MTHNDGMDAFCLCRATYSMREVTLTLTACCLVIGQLQISRGARATPQLSWLDSQSNALDAAPVDLECEAVLRLLAVKDDV